MNPPVGCEVNLGAAAGAGQADMGEAALLFQSGAALFVERALARKQALLPAGQEYVVEFESLGRMQRHQRHRILFGAAVAVHHQRDMFEEALQVLELLHRAHQLLEVFEAAGGVSRAIFLPHLGVAALVEHDLGQLGMQGDFALGAPAIEVTDDVAQGAARFRFEFIGLDYGAGRLKQRDAALAAVVVQHLQGGIAKAALRHIDDTFEREIVGRRVDDPQIGQRVADFGALVKPGTSDHAIGQAERDKTIFEFPHLERGAHQNGYIVELVAGTLPFLDLFTDAAGFFFRVPRAGDGDLFAIDVFGAQRLAEPAFIVRDQMRGGGEDVTG